MSAYVSVTPGTGPLVIDSPHSGTWYPDDFGYACALQDLRAAEDTHVEKLWSFAPRLGHSFIHARFARSYIDVNRDLAEIDPTLIEGGWPGAIAGSDKRDRGMGLLWRRTLAGSDIYRRPLTQQEVRSRIENCWRPYHAAMQEAVRHAHARHGWSLHLNCHSMPSDPMLYTRGGLSWEPSDFVIGDRVGTTAPPALTRWIAGYLRERGWRTEINFPFKGVELLRRHARPNERRYSVQVEVSRKLYMDELSLELHDGAARLAATLEGLCVELARRPVP